MRIDLENWSHSSSSNSKLRLSTHSNDSILWRVVLWTLLNCNYCAAPPSTDWRKSPPIANDLHKTIVYMLFLLTRPETITSCACQIRFERRMCDTSHVGRRPSTGRWKENHAVTINNANQCSVLVKPILVTTQCDFSVLDCLVVF